MPRLMPWTSSVPRYEVEALIVWIAPKWIGSPGLTVTHPNLSEEHFDPPAGALVPPPLGLLLPHAAATSASTATTPRRPNRVVFLIPPPSGPRWPFPPSSAGLAGPTSPFDPSHAERHGVRLAPGIIYHTSRFCTSRPIASGVRSGSAERMERLPDGRGEEASHRRQPDGE